jgi:TPR repeat protein
MTATDKGIPHDYAQALAIDRKQCKAKNFIDFNGCSELGILYENGLGVPTDLNQAIALYTKACGGKDPGGCAALKRLGK